MVLLLVIAVYSPTTASTHLRENLVARHQMGNAREQRGVGGQPGGVAGRPHPIGDDERRVELATAHLGVEGGGPGMRAGVEAVPTHLVEEEV